MLQHKRTDSSPPPDIILKTEDSCSRSRTRSQVFLDENELL
jgi:hypothetical protein